VRPIARIFCISAGGTAIAVATTLAAMPLLDPFWSQRDVRPGGLFQAASLYGFVALGSVLLVLLPVALFTDWLKSDRTRLLASVQAGVGILLSLPFITHSRAVSPAPVVIGTIILVGSLAAAGISLVSKESKSNG
jgi:hypothetical protein